MSTQTADERYEQQTNLLRALRGDKPLPKRAQPAPEASPRRNRRPKRKEKAPPPKPMPSTSAAVEPQPGSLLLGPQDVEMLTYLLDTHPEFGGRS